MIVLAIVETLQKHGSAKLPRDKHQRRWQSVSKVTRTASLAVECVF